MPINPDTYDRLHALYKRFDSAPEARFTPDGVLLKKHAYLAFLDSRKLVLELANEIHAVTRGWRPISSFFEAEPETPTVLLWAELPEAGQFGVTMGYWDDDEGAWYRECQGPDSECAPIAPTKWMRIGDLSLPDDEFVTIERAR